MEVKYIGSYGWGGDPESRWQITQPQQQQMPFAIAGGVIAGSALAAGTVVGTAATIAAIGAVIAGTLVAVGLVLTIVGFATGDSKLKKIGGYVGLAGGVVGLAGAGVGVAAGVGAVGTEGAMSATEAGALQSSNTAAKTAITPALQSVTDTTAPLTSGLIDQAGAAITPTISSTGTSTLGAAGTEAATSQLSQSGVGLGSEIGATPKLGSEVGTGLGNTGNQSSFFGFLDDPAFKNVLDVGKIAAQGIGGLYTSSQADKANQINKDYIGLKGQELNLQAAQNVNTNAIAQGNLTLAQEQQAYDQAMKTKQTENANTQGRGILTAKVLTAADRLQASKDRAAQAAANAKILTGSA